MVTVEDALIEIVMPLVPVIVELISTLPEPVVNLSVVPTSPVIVFADDVPITSNPDEVMACTPAPERYRFPPIVVDIVPAPAMLRFDAKVMSPVVSDVGPAKLLVIVV